VNLPLPRANPENRLHAEFLRLRGEVYRDLRAAEVTERA
jgi:hypothetical protein